MNKKDPRVIKTLRQIDQALIEKLKILPFEKITIEMICTNALINRSTFYKYYADKYDLLNDFLERTLNEFRQYAGADFVMATPSTIDDNVYKTTFTELIKYMHSKKDVYTTIWNASIGRNIWIEMIDLCENEIKISVRKNGRSVRESNMKYLDLYARLLASDLMNIIQWWFNNDPYITENDVHYVMNVKMKNGLFKAFKNYM